MSSAHEYSGAGTFFGQGGGLKISILRFGLHIAERLHQLEMFIEKGGLHIF